MKRQMLAWDPTLRDCAATLDAATCQSAGLRLPVQLQVSPQHVMSTPVTSPPKDLCCTTECHASQNAYFALQYTMQPHQQVYQQQPSNRVKVGQVRSAHH